jgi:two-component system, chemotaxis family, chemotaxis protein CheY
MNGWQFRKAQRQTPELASIPVLVLSAVRDLPKQAGEIEAVACLSKPVDIDHLFEVVGGKCSA